MSTEIIFSLVLASLFLGAIAWLVIYSRLQHRKAGRNEGEHSADVPEDDSLKTARSIVPQRAAKR